MGEETLSPCPSFNFYSSHESAELPTEVADGINPLETSTDSDSDFEFTFVRSNYDITTDDIFGRDKICQLFPIFDRDLLIRNYNQDQTDGKRPTELMTIRLPSEKSFVDDVNGEERDPTTPSSESDADELDSVPEETYCVWRPKLVEKSPSRCKKSNSTGTSASNQWKLRYFLHHRSNSEGTTEDSFVFLTPKNGELKTKKQRAFETGKAQAKKKASSSSLSSAHELFYVQNRAWKERRGSRIFHIGKTW
ncbi:hypothetical protein Vadar_016902 [Vaccinium darrowii]|uniref:Uncharacterized protein n=1 Tax=Vaccinium darrowii TaxID=229202 RepID=A0ACB7YE87_9ERIC|nr:hypothetical protein Vadar_016902 [Vaccinium darrowii]